MNRLIFIVIFDFLFLLGYSQEIARITIINGYGISYEGEEILLNYSIENDIYDILKINPSDVKSKDETYIWDGFNPESKQLQSGIDYIRTIKYKSIEFIFSSETEPENYELTEIIIRQDSSLFVQTNKGLEIGAIDPDILSYYPNIAFRDFIVNDSTEFKLYSLGISLHLDKNNNDDLILSEISIYPIRK